MTRADAVTARLPTLYGDGPVLRGLVDVIGVQAEVHDERGREVQRARWFDRTVELEEAAGLAAVLDIPPEAWHARLGEYRTWVHALQAARLRFGAVTPPAVRHLVETYVAGFERANRADLVGSVVGWRDHATDDAPGLVEWPRTRRDTRIDPLRPLERFPVENRGLDPAPLSLLFTGLGRTGPEHVPVVANLTTGRALIHLGPVPPGQRLWLRATGDDEGDGVATVTAELEGTDVSDQLRSVAFEPGRAWRPDHVEAPARPLTLLPGSNELWFLPVAHYGVPGLDRVLLALPDVEGDDLRSVPAQARWDEALLDRDLFVQEPAMVLTCAWVERTPATVHVELPAGTSRHDPGSLPAVLDARDRLETGLDRAVEQLAGAGITSQVRLRWRREVQRSRDRLRLILPTTHRGVGPTGADRQPDASGVYGVTTFDDSTYR